MLVRCVVNVCFGSTDDDGFTELLDSYGRSYGFINLNQSYGIESVSESEM